MSRGHSKFQSSQVESVWHIRSQRDHRVNNMRRRLLLIAGPVVLCRTSSFTPSETGHPKKVLEQKSYAII